MSINIFEGARRISLLIAGLASFIALAILVFYEPYVSVYYSVASPAGLFMRSYESCPSESTTSYFTTHTSSGKSVSINLCILAMSFGEKKELLIPYKVDEEGNLWGNKSYSDEVNEYERELERRFKVPLSDEKEIDIEISESYRKNFIEGLGYLATGLLAFGIFVWSAGWIVRGFLGIPPGKDKRQT